MKLKLLLTTTYYPGPHLLPTPVKSGRKFFHMFQTILNVYVYVRVYIHNTIM